MADKSTENFFKNVYYLADDTGIGITKIEIGAHVSSGYCANMIRRNSSPTIRVASSIAKFLGYSIDQLTMEPIEFYKEVKKKRNVH